MFLSPSRLVSTNLSPKGIAPQVYPFFNALTDLSISSILNVVEGMVFDEGSRENRDEPNTRAFLS